MNRHGPLGLLFLLLAAPPAFSQASALANCKYYTKVQQDFEQGFPYCEQAVKENPDDPECRFVAAWCLAEMGHLDSAWESFSWLIERKGSEDKNMKKHAENAGKKVDEYYARFFNKGIELLNAEDTAGARDAFRWATQIDPRQTGAYLNLGFTQSQLGELDSAVGSFEHAVSAAPGDSTSLVFYWDALGKKLEALRAEETPDQAALADVSTKLRTTLEKLLEIAPAGGVSADAHLQLADLDFVAGNRDVALKHMSTAIELDPDSIVNLVNRGIQFYQTDELEPAADALGLALDYVSDPSDEIWRKSTWVLGLTHFELEQWAEALVRFENLLEQDPDDLDVLPKAGLAARKAGKMQEGDRYLIRWEELKEQQVTGAGASDE